MKTLKDFINEHLNESKNCKNAISFDFNGIDGAEELLKSLEGNELVTIEDNVVSICVTEKNVTKIAPVKDIISQAVLAERNGTHTTNNETYALKVQKLEKALKDMEEMINSFNADDSKEDTPDPKDAAKKDADKNDDENDDDDKK
jgi:hypothetical protein